MEARRCTSLRQLLCCTSFNSGGSLRPRPADLPADFPAAALLLQQLLLLLPRAVHLCCWDLGGQVSAVRMQRLSLRLRRLAAQRCHHLPLS